MGNASCPPGEIQGMVDEADVDGDGTISFTEFVILISGSYTRSRKLRTSVQTCI